MFHLLHVVAQRFLGTLDTQGSDHYLVQLLRIFFQQHIQDSIVYYLDFLSISHIRDFENVPLVYRQVELAVQISNGTGNGILHLHVDANQRFAGSILDHAVHLDFGFLLLYLFRGQDYLIVYQCISDICSTKHVIQDLCYLSRPAVYRNNAVCLNRLVIIEEHIVGVLLYLIQYIFYGNTRHRKGASRPLGVPVTGRKL